MDIGAALTVMQHRINVVGGWEMNGNDLYLRSTPAKGKVVHGSESSMFSFMSRQSLG